MSSRESILAAIRAQQPPGAPLPELPDLAAKWIRYDDPLAQFCGVLQVVGARCHRVASLGEIDSVLAGIPEIAAARQIVSLVSGVSSSTVELAGIADPHALEDVDLAIFPGEFGVAENGAIWVTSAGVRHRALYILTQHLVLVIPADQIVPTMHEAYARIAPAKHDWGAFISGPSKTADIEQSLVIGAHGPRSLDVFCVG